MNGLNGLDGTTGRQLIFSPNNAKGIVNYTPYKIVTDNYVLTLSLYDHVAFKNILNSQCNRSCSTPSILVKHSLTQTKEFEKWEVCEYAKKIYLEPNAGGKSVNSEAISANVLNHLYNITDITTEMEIQYRWYNYKRCDYICELYGQRVGVSVTRAMGYPDPSNFTPEHAWKLLNKKIDGLLIAREGVIDKYNFNKCVLHVWCENEDIADMIIDQYNILREISGDEMNDIIVILSVTQENNAPFIYYNKKSDVLRKKYTI